MIFEICSEIRNFFVRDNDKLIGDFTIENGVIMPPLPVSNPRLIRIIGSAYNDGVHFVDEKLVDESFHGGVWIMSPPQSFLDLVDEIKEWQKQYGGADSAAMSPYQSESFGGYSYNKKSSEPSGQGWKDVYAARLNIYRKARL